MDNYGYQNYRRPPKKRGGSYILVALIAGIMGGIIAAYIAPNYLYGKILPLPEIYKFPLENKEIQQIQITPKDEINTVSAVARKNMESVVGITTVVMRKEWFWERPREGIGSGVVVSNDGYILTNSHVIGNGEAKSINVLFEKGDQLEGKVLWFDEILDLALVKVDMVGAMAADLGDSDDLEVGELAVAIGNPLGLEFQRSVTTGVVSGLHRSIRVDEYNVIEDLIQTDASINPGNSGGPLLNKKGEVIGINTAKLTSGEGLGFAIPINLVKPIIEEVIEEGGFTNAYIGFEGIESKIYERQTGKKLAEENGIVVVNIIAKSPAERAGIKQLDIIKNIDSKPIESMTALRKILYQYKIGDRAVLDINRNGKEIKLEIEFKTF